MSSLHFISLLAQLTPPDISSLPQTEASQATIAKVLQLVFTTIGAIAVMMVVIGGIKYSSSAGDPSSISKAKNTIIYALVGVVVSILAIPIIGFIFGKAT
jgi:hypothetical protein